MPARFDELPYISGTPQTPGRIELARQMQHAHTRGFAWAVIGDSRVSVSGDRFVEEFNAALCRRYGGVPHTRWSGFGNANGWLNGSQVSTLTASFTGSTDGTRTAVFNSTTSVTLGSWASTTDDLYNGMWVAIVNTDLVTREYQIVDYVGSTKVATLATAATVSGTYSVLLTPCQTSRLPTGLGSWGLHTSSYGHLYCLKPDNSMGAVPRLRSRLSRSPNAQFFALPGRKAPSALTNTDRVRFRAVLQRRAGSGSLQAQSLPSTTPPNSYAGPSTLTVNNWFTAAELDSASQAFISRTVDLPYAANSPYANAYLGAGTATVAAAPMIITARFEQTQSPRGITVDAFAEGGNRLDRELTMRPNMGSFFAAVPAYDAVFVALHANDAGNGVTPEIWRGYVDTLLARLRSAIGPVPIVLVVDGPTTSITGTNLTYSDQWAGVCFDAANDDPTGMTVAINRRRIHEENGFSYASELISGTPSAWTNGMSTTAGTTIVTDLSTSNDEGLIYLAINSITSTTRPALDPSNWERVESLLVDNVHSSPIGQRLDSDHLMIGLDRILMRAS